MEQELWADREVCLYTSYTYNHPYPRDTLKLPYPILTSILNQYQAHVEAVQRLHADPAHELLRFKINELAAEKGAFKLKRDANEANKKEWGPESVMRKYEDEAIHVSLAPYPLDMESGRINMRP